MTSFPKQLRITKPQLKAWLTGNARRRFIRGSCVSCALAAFLSAKHAGDVVVGSEDCSIGGTDYELPLWATKFIADFDCLRGNPTGKRSAELL